MSWGPMAMPSGQPSTFWIKLTYTGYAKEVKLESRAEVGNLL